MAKQPGPSTPVRNIVRWAITPPQSYVVYLICLFLVAGLSFYVGTLRPKKPLGLVRRRSPPRATEVLHSVVARQNHAAIESQHGDQVS
jgi:hypothetical protein